MEVIEPLPVSIAKYLDENGEDFVRRYYQVQRKNNPIIRMIYIKERDIRLYKQQLSRLSKQIGKNGVKLVIEKIVALEEEWQIIEDKYQKIILKTLQWVRDEIPNQREIEFVMKELMKIMASGEIVTILDLFINKLNFTQVEDFITTSNSN